MAYKQFALDERTNITIYKRRTSRNIRLTITSEGQVRVSIPTWVPYAAGLKFARERKDWISAKSMPRSLLADGDAIGKAHHLRFVAMASAQNVTGRINGSELVIRHPSGLPVSDRRVQARAEATAIRALKAEAEQLLPQRLADLATRHGFIYKSVSIKRLKSRWGSCDTQKNITLNLFLMQLPWDCIDYVLLHELTHTKIMRHGPDFWEAMRPLLPKLAVTRKSMRAHQPVLTVA